MSINMDLNKTPDLQDFLTMEPDLEAIKRSTSPVSFGIPITQNSTQVRTPAKLHMYGEPIQKSHVNENDSDADGNATDTTVSAIDEILDGIKSPSPGTAAAMENLLADEELTSTIPGSSPTGQLPTITAKMASTSTVIKPQPTLTKSIITRSIPSSLAGKMIAVSTSNKQQPLQIIKKAGGGGPIVTKYILKSAGNATGIAASKSGQKLMVATTMKKATSVVKSPIKKQSQPGSNIILSPIKGGFKIPISPMKSPIKVSVLGNASTKLQNIINSAPTTEVGRVHQYRVTPQGNISVQMPISNSANNGMITKTFSMQQPIFLRHKPTQTVSVIGQGKTNQSNSIIQQVMTSNQPIRVDTSGMKYQYVQIVNPNTSQSSSKSQGHPISVRGNNITINNPLTVIQQAPSGFKKIQQNLIKSGPQTLKVSVANPSAGLQVKQRLIMPATSMPSLRQSFSNVQSNSIITGPDNVGYAVVSAKYVEQLSKLSNSQQRLSQDNTNQHSSTAIIRQQSSIQPKTSSGKLKKPCNCTKSQCLKLYCECFANGHFCDGCNCNHCFNNLEHEGERSKAIKLCLERNSNAFRPKIGRGKDDHRTHQKGCNCKRSGCLKNYCECYEARIPCTSKCKCIGCKNYEETGDRRSLMSLADAAEVRERQQMAAKSKLSSQIGDLRVMSKSVTPSGERLPYTFFTQEVIEATCTCLLAQAEEAEKTNRSMSVAETMILEEFGRCLMQIIQSAGKAKVTNLT